MYILKQIKELVKDNKRSVIYVLCGIIIFILAIALSLAASGLSKVETEEGETIESSVSEAQTESEYSETNADTEESEDIESSSESESETTTEERTYYEYETTAEGITTKYDDERYKNLSLLAGFVSDSQMEVLVEKIEQAIEEENAEKATVLNYYQINEKKMRVVFYVKVKSKIYKGYYNFSTDTVELKETTLTYSDIKKKQKESESAAEESKAAAQKEAESEINEERETTEKETETEE